jgi:hypothetical protein
MTSPQPQALITMTVSITAVIQGVALFGIAPPPRSKLTLPPSHEAAPAASAKED